MIERIVHSGLEIALIVRTDTPVEGIRFHTDSDASLQVGQMFRPKGYLIRPHVHVPVPRTVSYTKEVLVIRSGRVRVDFYDEQQRYLESRELLAGDVVLLARGGHGFRMLEPSEIVEVKQGPYVGEHDKVRFDGIDDSDTSTGISEK